MRLLLIALSAFLAVAGSQKAAAQEFRGTISGTVTDSTGAVVPNAMVTAREVNTGTVNRTTSNGAGQYVIPFLLPGTYTIRAEARGFQGLERPGINLESQGHLIVNLALQIGANSETVTVSAAPPLIDLADASVGSVIQTESVANLPINGRAPTTLVEMAPGVISTGSAAQLIHPFDNNAGNQWSIGGTPNQVSEVLLDGSPDLTLLGAVAFEPTQDSVAEVSVRPFDTDASFGHTIGGVINQVTKSGTNRLRGTLYWFNQIPNFDGNLWFNSRRTPVPSLPVTHYNQYGLTAGGPILIPKIYNGKDKAFFFFAWERLKDSQPSEQTVTVPTPAEIGGDFSQTLAASSSNQLYNPFTATSSGKTVSRTAIPNNDLTSLGVPFDPIALNYLKLFPQPNATGLADGENNYISNAPSIDSYDNEFGRADYNLSSSDHIFFDFRHNYRDQTKNNYFGNGITGTLLLRENYGSTLDNVFTLNPTTVFDVRFNWTHFNEVHGTPATAYSPNSLGFHSYMTSASELPQMPFINFGTGGSCGSHTSYQCLGDAGSALDPTTSYQGFADMVKVLGNHTLKIGFDGRQYRMSIQNFGASSGTFTFNSSWVNSGTTGGVSNIFGGDLAAFLLGLASSGSYNTSSRADYHSYYIGTFVQDDWRVNNRLTVNLGLRFDIDTPFEERLGRTVNGFDPTAAIAYTTQPSFSGASTTGPSGTVYSVPSINTAGGLTFPNQNNGAVYATNNGFFSPRLGFSFAADNQTVIRGGFGIFVEPESLANLASTGTYSSSALSNQEGFSASTSFLATTNNYQSPASTLSSPYPNGFLPVAGSSMGASTFLGQSISFLAPSQHDAYSERW
ncbi:MAG TPA: TonB-dependent receptor, partial [Terracidiphilus sp.]|nr:TonB-dependent receptor [Terracidiphilus sp.]